MAVSQSQVTQLAAAILNASRTTYGAIDDNLHFQSELDNAALAADKEVVNAILATKGQRLRRSFAVKVSVTDGQVVTQEFLGGCVIDGKTGKPTSAGGLALLKQNPSNNTLVNGYYHFDGTIITFTGSTCQIDVIQYTPTAGTMQAPDECLMAVVTGCLALVFPKEGTNVAAAAHFASLFQICLQDIKDGKTTFAAPTPFTGEGGV